MKLKTKIHLFSTLLTFLIIGLMNIGVYFLFEGMAFDSEYNQLNSDVDEMIGALSKMQTNDDPATILRTYIPLRGGVRILDIEGEIQLVVQSIEEIMTINHV